MEESEQAELCKLIELNHRWPSPQTSEDEEGALLGSTFKCPVESCYHARGYEQCRVQERGWINEIKAQFKDNPWSLKNAGLVCVDGVQNRKSFSLKKFVAGEYKCKVFGHQHSFQATLECHEELPSVKPFKWFETKIYINLTPDMIRFLGEHQNTVDMAVKGRNHCDLMRGLRSTLQEEHGVLYQLYKNALMSEFVADKDNADTPGHYIESGLVAKLAKFEEAFGFCLPDNTMFPKGFSYYENDASQDEDIVLDDDIDAHMAKVKDWWPVMDHLDSKALLGVKHLAFAKHQVKPPQHNKYSSQWHVALFRQKTYNLCVDIMSAYAKWDLKGMKSPEASKASTRKRKSGADSGPAKKKGKKGVSNRVAVEEIDRTSGADDKRGAGILQEEMAARIGPPPVSMTFWNCLQGFAGEPEFNKVDEYLREILSKNMTLQEGGNIITQFKKERQVQKHLVSAAGVETWEEVKAMLGPYWCSQEKVEQLIHCLPYQRGGGSSRSRERTDANHSVRGERQGERRPSFPARFH
jgi:hypothetical protein